MTTTQIDTTQTISLAIKASPEAVWNALVDSEMTPAYYFGFRAEYDLTPGAQYRYTVGGGEVIHGRIVDVAPGTRLEATFNGLWDPAVAELPESTVTFTVAAPSMPMPGVTVLSLVHTGLPDTPAAAGIESGWVSILSGLKTLLETGSPLVDGPA